MSDVLATLSRDSVYQVDDLTSDNFIIINNNNVLFGGPRIFHTETISEKFTRLAREWELATSTVSSFDDMVEHPKYQEIIDIGHPVVPFMLVDLRTGSPKHWFYALRRITGANPIPKRAAGNLAKMTAAWLNWGRSHGYC